MRGFVRLWRNPLQIHIHSLRFGLLVNQFFCHDLVFAIQFSAHSSDTQFVYQLFICNDKHTNAYKFPWWFMIHIQFHESFQVAMGERKKNCCSIHTPNKQKNRKEKKSRKKQPSSEISTNKIGLLMSNAFVRIAIFGISKEQRATDFLQFSKKKCSVVKASCNVNKSLATLDCYCSSIRMDRNQGKPNTTHRIASLL